MIAPSFPAKAIPLDRFLIFLKMTISLSCRVSRVAFARRKIRALEPKQLLHEHEKHAALERKLFRNSVVKV